MSSLNIDPRRINGIYALDQWFKVEINSLRFDAYQLIDYPCEHVRFGEEDVSYKNGRHREPITELHRLSELYNCSTGARWTDAETGETLALSIAEIKAWRMADEATATKACPYLSREDARRDRNAYWAEQASSKQQRSGKA